jgi:hypothetical protein
MAITYYQAAKILDFNFGQTAQSSLGSLYLGLATTSVNDSGVISGEPVTVDYARVTIPNDKVTWSNASIAELSNMIEIEFAECTTSGGWGTINYIFIADALSGGNVLYYQQVTPKVVQQYSTVYFAVGGITVSMLNA